MSEDERECFGTDEGNSLTMHQIRAFLCQVAEKFGDTYFQQDVDLRYSWIINPAFPSTEKDIVGHTDAELSPLVINDHLIALKERLLQDGLSVRTHITMTIDGDERIFDLLLEPCRDDEGRVNGLFGYSRDITLQQRALDELKRENKKYGSFFKNAPFAMWEEDASLVKEYVDNLQERGINDISLYLREHPEEVRKLLSLMRVIDVNSEAVKLFEAADKSELLGSLDRVIPATDAFAEEIATLCQGETTFGMEGINRTLQGKDIYVFLRVSIVPGYERTWKRIIVSMADMTERRRYEAKLQESESKFRAIANAITEGVLLSSEGRIIHANEVFYQMVGYTPQELAGLDIIPLFNPQSREEVSRHLAMKLENAYETIFQRKDGSSFIAEVHGRNIIYEGRSARLTIIIDITDRKKLEEEREGYIRRLEEANRVKSDFVSLVSHELRAPLTMVRGYLDLLYDGRLGELNEEQLNALKIARGQSLGLQTLIEDLLDLSRMENDQLQIRHENIHIEEIIKTAAAAVRELYSRKDLYIKCDIEPGLPPINGDSAQLRRIINNLLDNAYKFTAQGGVTVRVLRQNDFIRIEVTDTGIGMTEEDMNHIFERFFQAEPVLTRRVRGTGLGLHLTRALVSALGGSIEAASRGTGLGSTFTVLLPAAGEEEKSTL